jgi:16S rRNA (uracil1498-N3)-methyltransferase
MPAGRFFIDSDLNLPSVHLEGDEFHHLARVMRLSPGETIELVNGKGSLATAEIASLHHSRAEMTILSHHTAPPSSDSLILALGLTRPSTLEWTVEKATELGATHLLLFPADRSEKQSPPRTSRLHTIIISALKQCGRLFLPTLEFRPPLRQWEPPSGTLFFGDLSPTAPHLQGPFSSAITFFIGPEKGFSPAELDLLSQTFHARGISLHANILRAETAALAALSQFFLVKA